MICIMLNRLTKPTQPFAHEYIIPGSALRNMEDAESGKLVEFKPR